MIQLDEENAFEVGTQNLSGLAGLAAGANFVLYVGLNAIARALQEMIARLRRSPA